MDENASYSPWSVLISVFMLYVSLPAFVIGVFFLLFDSTIGTTFFTAGGDPLLFQHLFWFFGHPEVYVVVVPAFGIVSEVLSNKCSKIYLWIQINGLCNGRNRCCRIHCMGTPHANQRNEPSLACCIHDYNDGGSDSYGCQNLQLVGNAMGWKPCIQDPHLWSLGFLITFTLGGLSGMFFPVAGLDTQFHDGYFVVAHFHYVFIGGIIFALFSGIYYWFPKVTGRKMNETLGLWHFLIAFSSYNAAFWPMHAVGIMGMPRRTHLCSRCWIC